MRLRSRSSSPQPGQSTEGVYTCEIMGEGLVSVGLYYSGELCHNDTSMLVIMKVVRTLILNVSIYSYMQL